MQTKGLSGTIAESLDSALAEIDRITRIGDAPLRNVLITQTYCDLSHGLSLVTSPSNANWSSFATWASKTAGQTIRNEEVPNEVAKLLRDQAHLEAASKAWRRAHLDDSG